MRFLLFTLYAPMASFGEIAVGERRMSWARPGRSAVLGLVAASLGLDRADEAAHRALQDGLYYAVRTDAPGHPFRDYHTAQAPKARKKQSFATRREEVLAEDLNTVLSTREWRADALFTVALWLRPQGTADIDAIARALCAPHFTLYLGRKAAPLGLPPAPEIVTADTFIDAFAARKRNPAERVVLDCLDTTTAPVIAFDRDAPSAPAHMRMERRRDAVVSRTRWQFADREEAIWTEEATS